MLKNALFVAAACIPAWGHAQNPTRFDVDTTTHDIASPSPRAGQDVIALTSGNRMTGTVQALSRGELSFAIDGAGTVDINWRNVETLVSTQRLDIELASGERLAGSVASATAGTLEITTGVTKRTVALNDVIRMTPIRATLRDRTTGSVDLGFALLNANSESDLTLNAAAENRTSNFLSEASLSLLVRHLDGETAQRRNLLSLASRRFGSNRWFGIGQLQLEQNRKLDLDLRTLVSAAPGRTLIQSQRTILSAYAGVDYMVAGYRDVPRTQHFPEALAAVEWDWFEQEGRTELSLEATTYAGLDRSRTRFELTSSLRRDIFRNFYLSLNFYQSYNSAPPTDQDHSDFGFGLTLGRAF